MKSMTAIKRNKMQARAKRTRKQLRRGGAMRPRLSIFRSGAHIYAQVIDDGTGKTIASASDLMLRDGKKKVPTGVGAAVAVGELIAEKAVAKKVTHVAFDRGGYQYHGRVKALADAARKGGLKF